MKSILRYKSVISAFDSICRSMNLRYYLIGAQARNLQLLHSGIEPIRGTFDIDFAVLLPEMAEFEALKNKLFANGFQKAKEPYRLIHEQSNTILDLLPFGEIEMEGTVHFLERPIELSVLGLQEVSEFAQLAELEELWIPVSPLEGLVILKLVSFGEKPDRKKDLDDIREILIHYFEINKDRFYADHLDVVEEIDQHEFILLAGARLLGRDMKKILVQSTVLHKTIKETVQNELNDTVGSITQYFLLQDYFRDYALIKNIFKQLLQGIEENK